MGHGPVYIVIGTEETPTQPGATVILGAFSSEQLARAFGDRAVAQKLRNVVRFSIENYQLNQDSATPCIP